MITPEVGEHYESESGDIYRVTKVTDWHVYDTPIDPENHEFGETIRSTIGFWRDFEMKKVVPSIDGQRPVSD